jgi:FkbM family methyltransferase
VIYVPTAVYKHVGGHSARRLSRSEVVERSYGGTLRYAGRHFGDWQRRVVGATFAVTSSIRALSVRRSDPELAKTYRRIGRRAATLALGNGFVKHPRVEPLVATALRGSAVRGSSRFALREVLGRGRVGRYRLRDADFDVLIRHGTADAAILGEVFYQRDYEFPQPVRAALEALGRPPVVADLGANIGLFGLWVLRSFPAAEIVAFEPDPANLAVLRRCVSLNERSGKWEVVPAAASTEDGAVPFTTGGGSVSRIAADEAAQTVPALDAFPYLERADLIKIDIEGGEWAILNDPRFADLRPAAVVLEFHPHMSPRPDTHAAAVELLSRTGLEIADGPDYGSGQGVLWGWRTEGRT